GSSHLGKRHRCSCVPQAAAGRPSTPHRKYRSVAGSRHHARPETVRFCAPRGPMCRAPPPPRQASFLIPPFHTLALNLSDQPRVGVPRVDQVDIVGDHALLDVGVEFGKEAQRELIPREYSDIDIAMPARLTSGTGTEQPYRGLISRPAYECSDAWRAM